MKLWSTKLLKGRTGNKMSPLTLQQPKATAPKSANFLLSPGWTLRATTPAPTVLTQSSPLTGKGPTGISGWVSRVTPIAPLIHPKEEDAERFKYAKDTPAVSSISLINMVIDEDQKPEGTIYGFSRFSGLLHLLKSLWASSWFWNTKD